MLSSNTRNSSKRVWRNGRCSDSSSSSSTGTRSTRPTSMRMAASTGRTTLSKDVTPPAEADWLIERAKSYLKEGDLNEARFLLRHARALAPDRADEIDELSGRIEGALEQLEASRPQMFDFEIEADAAERGKDERE